jgi:hypothetical protein
MNEWPSAVVADVSTVTAVADKVLIIRADSSPPHSDTVTFDYEAQTEPRQGLALC